MEIEKIEGELIGKILIDPDVLVDIDLKPEDFYSERHAQAYTKLVNMFQKSGSIDTVLMLQNGFNFQEVDLYTRFACEIVTSAGVKSHVDLIKDSALKRKIHTTIHQTTQSLVYQSAEHSLAELEKHVVDLQDKGKAKKAKTMPHLVDNLRKQIKRNETIGQIGKPTGFTKLDDAIVGIVPRSFMIIGGKRSVGKSAFLTQLILNSSKHKTRGLVFSLEDSEDIKVGKLACGLCDLSYIRLIHGNLNAYQQNDFNHACKQIEQMPISIYDNCFELHDIYMKTKKEMMRNRPDYVAVDYMQRVRVPNTTGIYERMCAVTDFLFNMSRDLNICVIAFSQLNKQAEFKGAGELEEAADVLIKLDREQGSMDLGVSVEKNRQFGRLAMGDKKINMTFTETWSGILEL